MQQEYTASDFRRILQELFPHRRLVLSQFTFFNHSGVAKPTGMTFRRGRRCYRLEDILSVACVLALKEEGIPLKNIESVPKLVQENASDILASDGWTLSGYGNVIGLQTPFNKQSDAIDAFLAETGETRLFWSFDVSALSKQVKAIVEGTSAQQLQRRAA